MRCSKGLGGRGENQERNDFASTFALRHVEAKVRRVGPTGELTSAGRRTCSCGCATSTSSLRYGSLAATPLTVQPPFPPRLLNITTTPQRYSSYEFLNPLIAERELPMVLDSELGMPLELGHVPVGEYGDGAYWEGKRDGALLAALAELTSAAICPKGPPTARLDPEDAFLMDSNFAAVPGTLAAGGSGSVIVLPGGSSNAGGERKKLDVSWLRRTEYLSSEGGKAMAGANRCVQLHMVPY